MTLTRSCAAFIGFLLVSSAALAAGAPPVAGTSPAPQVLASSPQLTATPLAVQPGKTLRLQGRGFPRNVHVALLAGPPHGDRARIGGALTGQRGRFTATIHIRPGSHAGRLVALACFDSCRVQASTPFRIVAP